MKNTIRVYTGKKSATATKKGPGRVHFKGWNKSSKGARGNPEHMLRKLGVTHG